MLTDEIRDIIRPLKNQVTLYITIGNTFRSDDGIGPYIYEKIQAKKNDFFKTLNARETPENIIDDAINIRPQKTVILDAADFDGHPGEVRFIPEQDIPESTLSTHSFSPVIAAKIIREDTGSEVLFIGIQVRSVEFGEIISEEVKSSADEIVSFILNQ